MTDILSWKQDWWAVEAVSAIVLFAVQLAQEHSQYLMQLIQFDLLLPNFDLLLLL